MTTAMIKTWASPKAVLLSLPTRPHPYVRTTQQSLWTKNSKKYAEWKQSVREQIGALSRTMPFSQSDVLGVALSFAAERDTYEPKIKKNGEKSFAGAKTVLNWDLDNLMKGVLDAGTGVLYPDDMQIRFAGPVSAVRTDCNFIQIFLWNGGSPWSNLPVSMQTYVEQLSTKIHAGSSRLAKQGDRMAKRRTA